ncbi:hypothetical protein, partial [Plasmodium yoelii yoelii]
YTGPTCI